MASWHDIKQHRGTRWVAVCLLAILGYEYGISDSVHRTDLLLGAPGPVLRQLRNARGISATPRRRCFGQNDHSTSSSTSMTEAQRWVKSFEER